MVGDGRAVHAVILHGTVGAGIIGMIIRTERAADRFLIRCRQARTALQAQIGGVCPRGVVLSVCVVRVAVTVEDGDRRILHIGSDVGNGGVGRQQRGASSAQCGGDAFTLRLILGGKRTVDAIVRLNDQNVLGRGRAASRCTVGKGNRLDLARILHRLCDDRIRIAKLLTQTGRISVDRAVGRLPEEEPVATPDDGILDVVFIRRDQVRDLLYHAGGRGALGVQLVLQGIDLCPENVSVFRVPLALVRFRLGRTEGRRQQPENHYQRQENSEQTLRYFHTQTSFLLFCDTAKNGITHQISF